MKRKSVRLILLAALLAFVLLGCGKKEVAEPVEEPQAMQDEEGQQIENQEKDEIKEDKAEAEEEVTTEEVTEDAERVIVNEVVNDDGTTTVYSSQKPVTEEEKAISEWVDSMEDEKTRLAIWNTETGKKEVLEPNGEYKIEEGDKIILCYCSSEQKYKTLTSPINWIEEMKKYPADGNYYTELKYRNDLAGNKIEFILDYEDIATKEYYTYSFILIF